MMKRRNQWIALAVTGALLLTLLYGCQASNTPLNVPGSTEVPVTERTADTTAATEAAATELPEIIMEATQATDNTESAQATEAPTEAPTEATDATTEPEATDPKPITPKPTEPKPTTPTPTQPKPTEPKPTTPTQPKPTQPSHTHSYGAWKQSKTASCTEAGTEVRSCSCGARETRNIAALGHCWSGWTLIKAPTCSAAGTETRSCSRCGQTESRTAAATGNHAWSETAPTCTQAGSKVCKVCGTKSGGAAALGHAWVHHDEVGHTEAVITCYCGKVFSSEAEWAAHFKSFKDDEEEQDNHAGHTDTFPWIVDTHAYDICSRCGITK